MSRRLVSTFVALLSLSFVAAEPDKPQDDEQGFVPLFNGKNLDGWVPINVKPDTFSVRDGVIYSTGEPTGIMRTDRMYENFILELDWRHLKPGGNAGLFVWSDGVIAKPTPFARAIEVQILDGLETENYTSAGDVFSIHGARFMPDRPHPGGWERCLPSEKRTKPSPEWNHYRVECNDGRVTLAVNGKVVSGGTNATPRKGYICLESEGSPAEFKNIRIKELPSTNPKPEEVATPAAATAAGDGGSGRGGEGEKPKGDTTAKAAKTLRVVVLGPKGEPVSNAKILANIATNEKGFQWTQHYTTDATGVALVTMSKTYLGIRLWASKKPFVMMFANWEEKELEGGGHVPVEYTFHLETGVPAGGWIVDERGEPISRAKVRIDLDEIAKPADGDGRVRYVMSDDAVTTADDGSWRIENVPRSDQTELRLLVSHPDYVADERWGATQRSQGITTSTLLQQAARITLKRGVVVRGEVTDPSGQPIKDAVVVLGDDPYFSSTQRKFVTDAEGRYRLPTLSPQKTLLTVIAAGFAPQIREVDLQLDLPPQNFQLRPGKPARIKIVDRDGKPLSAIVDVTGWKGRESLQTQHNPNHPRIPDIGIPKRADQEGVWEWASAPDEPIKLSISAKDTITQELEIAGGEPERTITLLPEHRITGRVTDAATGKPIPEFTVVQVDVFRSDWFCTERNKAKPGRDGRLEFLEHRTDIPLRLRVEAPGYRTQLGAEFRVGDDVARVQDFRLEPSQPLTGVVTDAHGRPVSGVEVFLATPTQEAELALNEFQSRLENLTATTDSSGRFEFPDPGEPWCVLARSEAGFAMTDDRPADQHDAGMLPLQPWASVSGEFDDGGKPIVGASVSLRPIRIGSLTRPQIEIWFGESTDADGRFQFERVPPIPVSLEVALGPRKEEAFRSGPSVPLDLQPGEHRDLVLGRRGAVVSGRVKLTGDVPSNLDCTYSLNYLVRREPGVKPPADIAALGFDVMQDWQKTWTHTAEGAAYLQTLPRWFVKLAPDGSFRISGVPPGEYFLTVEVYADPNGGCLVDPLAHRVVPVTVTRDDAAHGELTLPEIEAEVVPIPEAGDQPSLAFRLADGTPATLADSRGKLTVVHFWASWCGTCRQQLPAFQKLHDKFAGRGIEFHGLSLDDDEADWRAALAETHQPGRQGLLDANAAAGISAVPKYWLLDTDGKIIAKADDVAGLAAALEKVATPAAGDGGAKEAGDGGK